MNTLKLYVLTMGKDVNYVSRDLADAQYEKELEEEDTLLGRKLGIKLSEIEVNVDRPHDEIKLVNGCTYRVGDILDLL